MKRCKKCVMPDTRPGLTLNKDGVCQACIRHEERSQVDWAQRRADLKKLCDRHRKSDGGYDCIIPVSGGKDSTYQVKVIKEDMGMNPLLVNVSNFSWTDAGRRNYSNMLTQFDCECISLDLSPATAKKMFRYSFENFGSPTWYWDRAVYTYPLWIAKNFNIPLVIYGENISYEYGGESAEDEASARKQIENGVASEYADILLDEAQLGDERRFFLNPPPLDGLEPVYLSHFVPWSGLHNRAVAEAYGFKQLEHWETREGYIEQYDQIDAIGYLVHCWMKYPKFGHARATDVASYWIRDGIISRERAMELVRDHDRILDQNVRRDFCEFCGYSGQEFWNIVLKHKADHVKLEKRDVLGSCQGDIGETPRQEQPALCR
jgi:N-acetyl sugar amidotransferase